MATERDFITPADVVVLTTANVVGNTAFVELYSNTARAQTYPVFSQNFALSPYLDRRWTYVRSSNATYMAANGIITIAGANTPRFDYDPVTLQGKGLLLEEGRVNLVQNSTLFSNTAQPLNWGFYDGFNGLNLTLRANAGVAPDGSNTAAFLVHTTDVSTYYVAYPDGISGTIANNVTYTYSVFFKANTSPQEPGFIIGQYNTPDNVNSVYLQFTLAANGSITGFTNGGAGANVQVHSVGSQNYPNGWVRVYYSFRYTTGNRTYVQFKHELNSGGLTPASANVRGVYLWGAQLEQGPFPTSFIPTPVFSSATRVTDTAFIRGDNLNTFKDDKSMTVVDTVGIFGYHGNTTMTNSTEQRYQTVWVLASNPAPATPFNQFDPPLGVLNNPAQLVNFVAQNTIRSYFNGTTVPHEIQQYTAMFNNIENYIGFNPFLLSVNNNISNCMYVSTATTMRSNNWIMVSNGTLTFTTANYFAGANNNYFQIGPLNGYFKRLAIYNTQLSNTEMINITTL